MFASIQAFIFVIYVQVLAVLTKSVRESHTTCFFVDVILLAEINEVRLFGQQAKAVDDYLRVICIGARQETCEDTKVRVEKKSLNSGASLPSQRVNRTVALFHHSSEYNKYLPVG